MDIVEVSETLGLVVAASATKNMAEDAGRGLEETIVERIRKLFGHDRRCLDALKQCQRDGSPAAVADLAAELRQHSERDAAVAAKLSRWADEARSAGISQQVRPRPRRGPVRRDQTIMKDQHHGE